MRGKRGKTLERRKRLKRGAAHQPHDGCALEAGGHEVLIDVLLPRHGLVRADDRALGAAAGAKRKGDREGAGLGARELRTEGGEKKGKRRKGKERGLECAVPGSGARASGKAARGSSPAAAAAAAAAGGAAAEEAASAGGSGAAPGEREADGTKKGSLPAAEAAAAEARGGSCGRSGGRRPTAGRANRDLGGGVMGGARAREAEKGGEGGETTADRGKGRGKARAA